MFSTDWLTGTSPDADNRFQWIFLREALSAEVLVDESANQCGKADSFAPRLFSKPTVLLRF